MNLQVMRPISYLTAPPRGHGRKIWGRETRPDPATLAVAAQLNLRTKSDSG